VRFAENGKGTFASREIRRHPSLFSGPFPPHKRLASTPRFPDSAGVSYLYSLYDALVSIAVPSDKARAVVDAMERDMGTTLATKQDLEMLKQAMDGRFALVDQRFESLRNDLARDMVAMRQSIIIQLGSVIVVCLGLALAVVRLWL